MHKQYPIVIHNDPGSAYGVTVPDLPGCFTAGNTIEDALTRAAETIEFHIECLLLEGESVPSPQDSAIHQNNPDFADGIWKSVPINFPELRYYSIVIHNDPGSAYGVTVPDLPGCFTAGNTIEDALTRAAETIEFHIECLLLEGESVPSPQDSAIHQNNPDFADGIWKSVPINFKTLTESVLEKDSPSLLQKIMHSFPTSRLLPYAAGVLVLIIGGVYLGNHYFSPVPETRFPTLTPISPTKVEPTLVRGHGKKVGISPFGFGAFPKIPADFLDQNIWDVVEKRSIHDPDGARTLELLARVRIKLWEEGKRTKGVIMDPSSGLVYSDSNIKILFPNSTDLPKYDRYFDDGVIPSGGIVVEFLKNGIDPYEFLNLPR